MNAPPALGYPPGVSLPPTGALCHCHWPLIAAVLSRCASSWSRLLSHPLSRRDLKIRRPPLFRGFLEMVSLTRVSPQIIRFLPQQAILDQITLFETVPCHLQTLRPPALALNVPGRPTRSLTITKPFLRNLPLACPRVPPCFLQPRSKT